MTFFALNGKRFEIARPAVFGSAFVPANDMFGTRYCGLASGKNCGRPSSTSRRSFRRYDSSLTMLTYCFAQFIPMVTSATVVGLIVLRNVLTRLYVRMPYSVSNCGQPMLPPLPVPAPRNALAPREFTSFENPSRE